MQQNERRFALTLQLLVALVSMIAASVQPARGQQMAMRTETFDTDPGWDGHNNRATDPEPRQIVQNFGYSASTSNAGGPAGEIGGFITPAGEPAFYGAVIADKSFNDPLSASGTLNVPVGGGHTLIGFFNSDTVNEWRTPNTIALRIYGRDSYFLPYSEYGTSKWRVGGGSIGFGSPVTSGATDYPFSLNYDPNGAGGLGTVTATLGNLAPYVITLAPGHKADGATFNRFGILNVVKSADGPGELWLDNLTINGATQSFNTNPGWDHLNNQTTYISTNVRPRFDFGYSPTTNYAGGQGGEMGGQTFRGDSRLEFNGTRMAFYGDQLDETLTLNQPLHADGKVAFQRGVSDSTTLIGFFNSTDSIKSSNSQSAGTPENFVGVAIEGPSAEGFYFYPTYGLSLESVGPGGNRGTPTPPYIYPNGDSHDWTLDYNPTANGGKGSITVTLDGQAVVLNLATNHKQIGANFDRFGIITTHIDGSGQTVFFDDLTYTVGTAPVPGDLNGDALVNDIDYGIIKTNWLQNVAGVANGNLNGDSIVDLTDFLLFKGYYQAANPGAGGALQVPVPEPSAIVSSAIALLGLFALGWRRMRPAGPRAH